MAVPNLKPYAKALAPYWTARRLNATAKYLKAAEALKVTPRPDRTDPGETVLIFSSMGVFGDHLVVDALLARALELQGARVIIVVCDQQMSACHVTDRYSMFAAPGRNGRSRRQRMLCSACFGAVTPLVRSDLTYAYFSEGIQFLQDNPAHDPALDLDEQVDSGVIRYAASSHRKMLEELPADVKQKYRDSAEQAARAIDGLIRKYRPGRIIAHHGIYVPQGIVQKLAHEHGITFYSWHFGYRKSTLIFSLGDTYHRELVAPQPNAFVKGLTSDQENTILTYLKSRMSGSQDWIHFNRNPKSFVKDETAKGYFVFYTSVDWDAALHFPSSVFRSQFDCISKLIDIFRKVPDYTLVIRVHPAEVTGFHPAAFSIEDHLKTLDTPANVKIVKATDPTSSYDLAKNCLAALVYNTKLGIELPPFGIPTIVMGDCWIRGKGFSYDVNGPEELEHYIVNGASLTVTDEQKARALQFAYYFYFQRCISTRELVPSGKKFQVSVDTDAWAASHGAGTGMAFAAARILNGVPVEADR